MLSQKSLERYRSMTTSERLRLAMEMTDEATPYLCRGTPEQVERRFELIRRENNERNRRILEGIRRARGPRE